jgi:hypothetical protein
LDPKEQRRRRERDRYARMTDQEKQVETNQKKCPKVTDQKSVVKHIIKRNKPKKMSKGD